MKISTFNVNGVNGRLPRLLEWLEETTPDIACLQEIKTGDEKFPDEALDAAGYGALWHGQRAHHGVAILAEARRRARSGGACPATTPTCRPATSKQRLTAFASLRSTCPTAIPSRGRSSTTSWPGSSG